MRDFGVTDFDSAEQCVSKLKSLQDEFEQTIVSLEGCITNLNDLEETGGLAEQVVVIYNEQVKAMKEITAAFPTVIKNLQADIDGSRQNYENMQNNALSGLL